MDYPTLGTHLRCALGKRRGPQSKSRKKRPSAVVKAIADRLTDACPSERRQGMSQKSLVRWAINNAWLEEKGLPSLEKQGCSIR